MDEQQLTVELFNPNTELGHVVIMMADDMADDIAVAAGEVGKRGCSIDHKAAAAMAADAVVISMIAMARHMRENKLKSIPLNATAFNEAGRWIIGKVSNTTSVEMLNAVSEQIKRASMAATRLPALERERLNLALAGI